MTAWDLAATQRRWFVNAGLLLLLLPASCTMPIGAPGPSGAPPTSAPLAGSSLAAVERDVITAVNRTRQGSGLSALREDAVLNRAAREHSDELAARGTLDHTSTDPARRTMTMRIEAAGGTWSRAAENLASMSGQASDVPSRTVQMWLNSAGHRQNMMSSAYTHTGVGVAIDRRGIWYVTQLYVVP